MIRRRTFIGGAAGLITAPHIARADEQRITVTSYGGIWEGGVRDAFVAPFKKLTGVEADIQLGTPEQWINQVAANQAHPPIDVIVSTPDLLIAGGRRGLFDKVSRERLPAIAGVPDIFVTMCEGYGCGFDYAVNGIAYHKGRVPDPPKSLHEMVDRVAKGEFQCSLMNLGYQPAMVGMLWSLNDAFGGTLDNLTPGLEAVKRMRPNTIFWSGITDFLNHIASGQADLGIYPDGRTWAAHDSGMAELMYLNPAEKGSAGPVGMAKPLHANPLAWDYINLTLSPGPQGVFGERLQYGMSNSHTQYSEKLKARIVPFSEMRIAPFGQLAAVIPAWIERWNKEIGA